MYKLTKGNVVRIVDTEQKKNDLESKGFKVVTEEEQAEIERQNQLKKANSAPANTSAAELKTKNEEITKLEAEKAQLEQSNEAKDSEIKSLKLNTLGMQKEAKQVQIVVLETEKADADTKGDRKKVIDKELETINVEVEAIDEEIKSLNL